jgi:hypothetical protein
MHYGSLNFTHMKDEAPRVYMIFLRIQSKEWLSHASKKALCLQSLMSLQILCADCFWITQMVRKCVFILLFFFYLLAYYSWTGSTLWHSQKCLLYILVRFITSIFPLFPPSPLVRIVQQVSLCHFHTWIHSMYLTSFFFFLCLPLCHW